MSEQYKIKGAIKVINETQTFESGFSKREFVITTKDKYPQDVKLEVVKESCDFLDNYKTGDEIEVFFNIRGNDYKGNYYVNLQAWKILGAGSNKPKQASPPASPTDSQVDGSDDEGDIPF